MKRVSLDGLIDAHFARRVALSGGGLGLSSSSRPSFKSGSPTSASAIAAATAAFNSPSATASLTAVRSPVSLVQQQQQIQQQQQQQQKIQQALAGSPYLQQPGVNTSNAALGDGNFGVPLLQMPALNPSTSLSMSVQLANLKSRLALQRGSLLAQALRLTQQPDFASVADLPLLANVRKLAKSSSSSSLTAAASAPAAVGSPPHSSAPSGCSSPSAAAAAFSAASEPFCMRRSSLSSSGRCLSPNASFVAADGQGNGRLAPVMRMPSFDVSSVCKALPSAAAAAAAAGTAAGTAPVSASADDSAEAVLPVDSAASGRTFTGGGGGLEGGGGRGADDAFASLPSSSFTALLTSSASANHRLASMASAAPAPVISHTWRPQGNARCLQKTVPVESASGASRETQIQQQQVYQSQQQALNFKLQQQQQQEMMPQVQQVKGQQQVMSQRPDMMLLEAFSSARCANNDRHTPLQNLDCSQNEPQQTLDAGSGDPWGALNTTEDARLANIISSGSLEAVVAGNGRISEFPLTSFDDQKPLGAAEFQSEEAMFSSLSHNGMFAEMPASFSESDMLQAIHAEMEYILDNSSSPYAQVLASSSLVKQVTDHTLPVQLRLDIRNYVVSFLATKGPKAEWWRRNYVVSFLATKGPKAEWWRRSYVVSFLATKGRKAESFVTASLVQLLCLPVLLVSGSKKTLSFPSLWVLLLPVGFIFPCGLAGNYVVSFLATKGPKAESFVTASLVQLLCRISKLGWYDDERFRDIVDECTKFLAQVRVIAVQGLKIFNQLVAEMNQPSPGRSLTFHRKTACSFRDLALFAIFQISLTSLRQLQSDDLALFAIFQISLTSLRQLQSDADDKLRAEAFSLAPRCLSFDFVGTSLDESSEELGTIQVPSIVQDLTPPPSSPAADDKLRAEAVSLALRCLSFDFVGTSLDESSEELGTIQVPSSWRAVLEDTATMQLFFDYYAATKPPLSNQCVPSSWRAVLEDTATMQLFFDYYAATKPPLSNQVGFPAPVLQLVPEDTATVQLFFDYYAATKPPLSNQAFERLVCSRVPCPAGFRPPVLIHGRGRAPQVPLAPHERLHGDPAAPDPPSSFCSHAPANQALECLVRLASVRRSLFTGEAERLKFLSHLMNGSTEILRSKQGLSQHDNYHEYCRLLGRLKTNYQLAELVNAENYAEWVQLVAQFTITSLQSWQWVQLVAQFTITSLQPWQVRPLGGLGGVSGAVGAARGRVYYHDHLVTTTTSTAACWTASRPTACFLPAPSRTNVPPLPLVAATVFHGLHQPAP
ncbi:unnamed protein product [Closterium sp. Naga37s-1]|nr:unnamed protein product [Closterium sp. Naga37s-1]